MQIVVTCPADRCGGELVFVAGEGRGSQLWTRCRRCGIGFGLHGGSLRSVPLLVGAAAGRAPEADPLPRSA
ncbi:MAG TPA: hypothetical protein VGM93_12430 [Acidimicrobiales bacterium]